MLSFKVSVEPTTDYDLVQDDSFAYLEHMESFQNFSANLSHVDPNKRVSLLVMFFK